MLIKDLGLLDNVELVNVLLDGVTDCTVSFSEDDDLIFEITVFLLDVSAQGSARGRCMRASDARRLAPHPRMARRSVLSLS